MAKGKLIDDPELVAMYEIGEVLAPLSQDMKLRVLFWLQSRVDRGQWPSSADGNEDVGATVSKENDNFFGRNDRADS